MPLSGSGSIYSYIVHHHPPIPGFTLPYVVVLVDLVEGIRMIGNLVDADIDLIADGKGDWLIGREVSSALVSDEGGDMVLANWRLMDSES